VVNFVVIVTIGLDHNLTFSAPLVSHLNCHSHNIARLLLFFLILDEMSASLMDSREANRWGGGHRNVIVDMGKETPLAEEGSTASCLNLLVGRGGRGVAGKAVSFPEERAAFEVVNG
jgi:hypothetical protein